MSARHWKWLAATALLIGALAIIAILYRDSIGQKIVNAALEDSDYTVSDLSVASLSRSQLRLSELLLERRDGTRIAIEGVTLPVDLSMRRPESLSVDRVVYTPAGRDERRTSYSELLQLGLGAHRLFPGGEIRVAQLRTPWLPDLTDVVWESTAASQSAAFEIGDFAAQVAATEKNGGNFDLSAQFSELAGHPALSLTAETSLREGDVLVSGKAEVELEHWLHVLHALGAIPEEVTSLRGTIYGPLGIVVPWARDGQIVFSGAVSADDAVELAYASGRGLALRARAVSEQELSWIFQYPSLDWSARAGRTTVTARSERVEELVVGLADAECRSGIRCEFVASYRDEGVAGETWKLAIFSAVAPLSLDLGEELRVSSTRPATITLRGIDIADHGFEAIELSGNLDLSGTRAAANMRLSDADGLAGRLTAFHDLETGAGSMVLQDASLDFGTARASERLREWPYQWDLLGGELRPEAKADWRLADGDLRYSGTAHVDLVDIAGGYNELVFKGVDGAISLDFDARGGINVKPVDVTVELLDIGLPVETLSATLQPKLADGSVEVSALMMRALGGTVSAEPFVYSMRADANRLVLDLDSIQLQLMVDLVKSDGVTVDGSVSGELPVSISATGVAIEGGTLSSDAPGGLIRNELPIPGAARDPRLEFVQRALSNFEFDDLSANVSYAGGGDLVMKMRISGSNPDIDPDQPVVVNLGLENNLPQLLRSLQAARSISDILGRKVTN